MTQYDTIQQSDRIARITLSRPEAANGITDVMARELSHVATHCDTDPGIKAVILTGSGRFFSAGGDLKSVARNAESPARYAKLLTDQMHRAVSTFARMDAPLIVAVNGIAAGAGFSLAIMGDIVIAAQTASFTMAFSRAGLSPDGGASFYLPRLVGLRRAQDLMLNNRSLSADEALQWGLVTEVVATERVLDTAQQHAERFASGSKQANATIKKLLLASYGDGLENHLELEARSVAACVQSADGREGVAAFLEKRSPSFS